MAISFGYSPWLLVLSLLLAGGLTFWSYRATVPSIAVGWRWVLGSLRFVSLALLCFLLLRPVVRHLSESDRPPLLAVVVDDSRSMRVVGGEAADTSAQAVRDRLRSALDPLLADLPGEARLFAFDQSLRALRGTALDSLSFSGARSDVGTALQNTREALQGENLRGIALVSDGQYNSGRNPARVADRFSVPVHTVTVGDTTRRRDVQVRRVATNDLAYVDTEVPVQVTLGAEDAGDETVSVSLQRDDTVLARTDVTLPAGTAEVSVNLSYRPENAGLKQLTVRASTIPREATTRNNVRSVAQRVLESKRRVLVLGAAPSPSYAALRRVLSEDANTTVTARVPRRDGSFYGGPLPDTLSRYDAVVVAGFPSEAVRASTTERVAATLNENTPAVFVLDRQTDVSAWREHFSGLLPAQPETARLDFVDAAVSPVAAERSHPAFQIEGADLSLLGRLPPVAVPSTAWTPTPDATVLATARRPSLSRNDPVLVVRRRAGQRTAALLATDTWRWATLSPDLAAADPLWPGLVSNLLRWVATQNDDRQVRVRPVTSTFEGDEPVSFTGQVYDDSMTPVADATVDVTITDSTGTEYPHAMTPIGNGRYDLSVGALPEGTYRYEAVAEQSDRPLGRDQGQFSVGALRLEYQQTRANPVLMRQIAARSGGRAYTSSDAASLSARLSASESFSPVTVTNTSEAELWRTSLFLALLLGLLAAEWTLRKRFGLT
jgi:hypothetical protein